VGVFPGVLKRQGEAAGYSFIQADCAVQVRSLEMRHGNRSKHESSHWKKPIMFNSAARKEKLYMIPKEIIARVVQLIFTAPVIHSFCI